MRRNLSKILTKNERITIAVIVILTSYVVGYVFDNPIALFILLLYGIFLIYSHFKKRVDRSTLSRIEIFAKIITILTSLTFFLFFISQFGDKEGKQAGVVLIMFCIVILLPYVITIITIDFSKIEAIVINLLIGVFFSFMIFGFIIPALGALISFSFPLLTYIAIYLKKSKKTRLVALSIAMLYVIFTPYYFIQGTDVGHKLKDPCFKRERFDKGETHYIKGNRVCAFIYKDSWNGYYSTVTGADTESYESVGTWYTKDKNNVYYGHKKIDADVNTFKYENHIFSDKNGIWKEGKLSIE